MCHEVVQPQPGELEPGEDIIVGHRQPAGPAVQLPGIVAVVVLL